MISSTLAIAITVLVLAGFAYIGFTAGGSATETDIDDYMTARNSQSAMTLGLSFFASGVGAWVLFVVPEVGAFVGIVAVVGYALAQALPLVVFAQLGPRLRRVAPTGRSLTEFVKSRFGGVFHAYVIFVSVFYMATFLTAELTGIASVVGILSDTGPTVVILLVAVITLTYTAYGGLRASMRTDRVQTWLVVALAVAAGVVVLTLVDAPGQSLADSGLMTINRVGMETAITLIIAVVAANMFHQGYWQRVFSAEDNNALVRGGSVGVGLTIPILLIVGLVGILAAGAGLDLGTPPVPFFAVLAAAPNWVGVIVLILGVALVASSVDTLENALASLAAAEQRRISVTTARWLTVALMVPVVFVAVQGYSVLRLFLIADLVAAATVVPAMYGLWSKATNAGAVAGSIAGLIGAVAPGWITEGTLSDGVLLATFPDGVPTLPPFLWSIIASTVVAVGVSLVISADEPATVAEE